MSSVFAEHLRIGWVTFPSSPEYMLRGAAHDRTDPGRHVHTLTRQTVMDFEERSSCKITTAVQLRRITASVTGSIRLYQFTSNISHACAVAGSPVRSSSRCRGRGSYHGCVEKGSVATRGVLPPPRHSVWAAGDERRRGRRAHSQLHGRAGALRLPHCPSQLPAAPEHVRSDPAAFCSSVPASQPLILPHQDDRRCLLFGAVLWGDWLGDASAELHGGLRHRQLQPVGAQQPLQPLQHRVLSAQPVQRRQVVYL